MIRKFFFSFVLLVVNLKHFFLIGKTRRRQKSDNGLKSMKHYKMKLVPWWNMDAKICLCWKLFPTTFLFQLTKHSPQTQLCMFNRVQFKIWYFWYFRKNIFLCELCACWTIFTCGIAQLSTCCEVFHVHLLRYRGVRKI